MKKNIVQVTMDSTEVMRAFDAIETKVNKILNLLERCEEKMNQNLETTSISDSQ